MDKKVLLAFLHLYRFLHYVAICFKVQFKWTFLLFGSRKHSRLLSFEIDYYSIFRCHSTNVSNFNFREITSSVTYVCSMYIMGKHAKWGKSFVIILMRLWLWDHLMFLWPKLWWGICYCQYPLMWRNWCAKDSVTHLHLHWFYCNSRFYPIPMKHTWTNEAKKRREINPCINIIWFFHGEEKRRRHNYLPRDMATSQTAQKIKLCRRSSSSCYSIEILVAPRACKLFLSGSPVCVCFGWTFIFIAILFLNFAKL